jgi:hypothetical protein
MVGTRTWYNKFCVTRKRRLKIERSERPRIALPGTQEKQRHLNTLILPHPLDIRSSVMTLHETECENGISTCTATTAEFAAYPVNSQQYSNYTRNVLHEMGDGTTNDDVGTIEHLKCETDYSPTIDTYSNVDDLPSVPQWSTRYTFRFGLTILASLLAVAGCLTVIVATQYKLFIAIFWIILIAAFVGLVWFAQTAVLVGRRPFHPAVHAVADWIVTECHNFVDDWRNADELLLLTNESKNEVNPSQKLETLNNAENFQNLEHGVQRQTHWKPKSAIFRAVVKPFLLLRIRRKRKSNAQGLSDASNVENTTYTPPDVQSKEVM